MKSGLISFHILYTTKYSSEKTFAVRIKTKTHGKIFTVTTSINNECLIYSNKLFGCKIHENHKSFPPQMFCHIPNLVP